MKSLIKLALPLVLLAAACTTVKVGNDFDLSAFTTKVQRGVTTQADVKSWLGAPAGTGVSVDTNGERYDEWMYYHGAVKVPGSADSRVRVLQIKFDAKGVVRGYNWSGERG
jgi:hypothetical protein